MCICSDTPADPIYDDGDVYGADRATKKQEHLVPPHELRARAAELEDRMRPVAAGPGTGDERTWLEKAAALREEADRLEFAGRVAGL
ncbi:hypothetical protein OG864_51805 [Streptomyces sp. NBC_00124]|uniref:hypothetical protein n=1 Tax=Streptomyces sp. NBC_00124 TaxID=2975662 RepID=UPI0022569FC5|nr:hypothetical protein [Streptomyces sp. NBC_00124]MCX5367166.1 hypothetical protein [Streptomyces sp. NBC_00124]